MPILIGGAFSLARNEFGALGLSKDKSLIYCVKIFKTGALALLLLFASDVDINVKPFLF